MVVHDLDIFCSSGRPTEAHPELVVHSNAVLPGSATLQHLKPVSRRDAKIFKPAGNLQLTKLSACHRFDVRKPLDPPSIGKRFSIGTPEGYDHTR